MGDEAPLAFDRLSVEAVFSRPSSRLIVAAVFGPHYSQLQLTTSTPSTWPSHRSEKNIRTGRRHIAQLMETGVICIAACTCPGQCQRHIQNICIYQCVRLSPSRAAETMISNRACVRQCRTKVCILMSRTQRLTSMAHTNYMNPDKLRGNITITSRRNYIDQHHRRMGLVVLHEDSRIAYGKGNEGWGRRDR